MKVIKVPFSGGGLNKGTGANKAPDEVEKQLNNVFSNENQTECKFQCETLDLDENNIEESHNKIENKIQSLNEKAILLGGDHSITYPAVKGFSRNNAEFTLIIFDAHPDLMHNFVPPTQEDYLRVLIEQNIVKPENIIIIGVRNWDKIELDFLKEHNIIYYTCKQLFEEGFRETIKKITEQINNSIYLSIDIDAVDPTEAIGTGYTEHGGLSSRQLIYAIQQLKQTNKLKMVDLVEINPSKDINNITSALGAKLLAELCDF